MVPASQPTRLKVMNSSFTVIYLFFPFFMCKALGVKIPAKTASCDSKKGWPAGGCYGRLGQDQLLQVSGGTS